MSLISPKLDQSPIMVWDENTTLTHGIEFLCKKKQQLDILNYLWSISIGADYYSNDSKVAAEKVKVFAEKSKQEIKDLDDVANALLSLAALEDPSSDETIQLLKIVSASRCALNYFTSVLNNTYYPTFGGKVCRNLMFMSNKLIGPVTLLAIAGKVANSVFCKDMLFDNYISILWKRSMAACIYFNLTAYIASPSSRQNILLNQTEKLFEQSISFLKDKECSNEVEVE